MRILIVNDDGIKAPGIRKLAELSMQLGEVWVVAPKSQCSAMSQRITLFEDIEVTPECYDLDGVRAYTVCSLARCGLSNVTAKLYLKIL